MLRNASIFFMIAIIAAFFGFGESAAGAATIAKFVFFVSIVLALSTLLTPSEPHSSKNAD